VVIGCVVTRGYTVGIGWRFGFPLHEKLEAFLGDRKSFLCGRIDGLDYFNTATQISLTRRSKNMFCSDACTKLISAPSCAFKA
jgi:hypothetical protein